MSSTKIQSFLIVVLASLMSFVIFLFMDFLFGHYFLTKPLSEKENPHLSLDQGWYELKKNFKGQDQWGPLIYLVETDRHGHRKSPNTPTHEKYDFIFLGDSFTYGVNGPWNETFVGMFELRTGAKVINAGVSSYSPTPYLYQYQKVLKSNILTDKHTVIIGIDISDVHDEASYWAWDDGVQAHPRKMEYPQKTAVIKQNTQSLRAKIHDYLPLTVTMYRYLRYSFYAPPTTDFDMARSAFTWMEWSLLNKFTAHDIPQGYGPLGVEKGLEKVSDRLVQIVELASKSNSQVYFLIYPWPAQIVHSDKFDWSGWVSSLCIKAKCAGVIDVIPSFRALAEKNKNWLEDYYVRSDFHFNEGGNNVVAEHLVKSLPLPLTIKD